MTYIAQNQNAWRADVSTDGSTWYKVVGLTSSNFPGLNAGLKDSSSYDNDGWGSQAKTSMSWSLELDMFPESDSDSNEYAQSYQILNSAQLKFGSAGTVQVRWGRTDKVTPFEGYQGTGFVSKAPGNTGWDDLRSEKFTISGTGKATELDSEPTDWTTASVPQVAGITPAGAAVGDLVFIKGSGFTGVTASGVAFGSTASTDAAVDSDSLLAVSVPTGASGTVSVVVTNATGDSSGFSYTVGS